ncbi:MAG: hypothetical protein Satyrvirus15_21, partial [Satyrvirus sp.]
MENLITEIEDFELLRKVTLKKSSVRHAIAIRNDVSIEKRRLLDAIICI